MVSEADIMPLKPTPLRELRSSRAFESSQISSFFGSLLRVASRVEIQPLSCITFMARETVTCGGDWRSNFPTVSHLSDNLFSSSLEQALREELLYKEMRLLSDLRLISGAKKNL
jgi:hypothetical protein